jgi:hypothetical protein
VHCAGDCGVVPLPESQLPVVLPALPLKGATDANANANVNATTDADADADADTAAADDNADELLGGGSPLASAHPAAVAWRSTTCPQCGGAARKFKIFKNLMF